VAGRLGAAELERAVREPGRVVTAALAVVPGPGGTVTFVLQERGPYAGYWLLPGGKVEFGEPVIEAARREAAEESGCAVGALDLTGAYEIRGPDHHFVVWAYRSRAEGLVPAGFSGHHVAGVRQARWDELEPHPTDMPILNDAGAAAYPHGLIEERLARAGICMANVLTGEVFGRAESVVAGG
jgi:8-oxo-dGTP diphosphatase